MAKSFSCRGIFTSFSQKQYLKNATTPSDKKKYEAMSTLIFMFVFSSSCIATQPKAASLMRDKVSKYGYANFVKHENSTLNVSTALNGFCSNYSEGLSFKGVLGWKSMKILNDLKLGLMYLYVTNSHQAIYFPQIQKGQIKSYHVF